jgi:hypothetical protein
LDSDSNVVLDARVALALTSAFRGGAAELLPGEFAFAVENQVPDDAVGFVSDVLAHVTTTGP